MNSYFIVESEGNTFPKETSLPSDIIFPEENPIPSPVLADTHTSEFSKLKAKLDLIKKYIENLNAETEKIKMFIKDQFCLLKYSSSKKNVCESAENTKVIELLQQQNQNLKQKNASKNIIESTTVNSKFRQKKSRPRRHKIVDLNCSNRYETLYITDNYTESEVKILMI